MADAATTTTPPATPSGITAEQVSALIQQSLEKALAPITKGLGDLTGGLTALQQAQAKALTPESIAQTIDQRLTAHTATQATQAARHRYLTDKMADLPAAYRDLMPATDDPAKLATAEQEVRSRFKAELGDKLAKATNVTTSAGGTTATVPKVDVSKLSPTQKIESALTQSAVKA